MDFLKTLLEHQPLMTLFLTIAIGYFVGEINIKGFSLGVGAVLFVALAAGWFAPKSAPAPMVGTLGLSLFLYTVGVQYGAQFFLGLTSAAGRRANLLALIGVLCAGATSVAIQRVMQINPGYALGRDYPEYENGLLVAITEQRSRADIDRLADVLARAVAAERVEVSA